MRRVVVVGGPGSGKTTVAAVLSARLDAPHVELDELWWDAGWTPAGREEFRRRLTGWLAGDRWILDGNYVDEIADLAWPQADAIVWLDQPRRIAVRRAMFRAVKRALGTSDLWNGNRESQAVLSPMSIARLIRRWPSYSDRIERAVRQVDLSDDGVVRLRSDRDVDSWLETVSPPR